MKTSKIIFSIALIAGVLFSTATMAQTRVIFTTRIVAPAPQHYHPQPPVCGGYCAPVVHYNYHRPVCAPQRSYNNSCHTNNYNNNYHHRNGNNHGHGNGYREGDRYNNRNDNRYGNGRGNHPRHN